MGLWKTGIIGWEGPIRTPVRSSKDQKGTHKNTHKDTQKDTNEQPLYGGHICNHFGRIPLKASVKCGGTIWVICGTFSDSLLGYLEFVGFLGELYWISHYPQAKALSNHHTVVLVGAPSAP